MIVPVTSDPARRGRVLALQAIMFLRSTPIGGPIAGLVRQRRGTHAGIALAVSPRSPPCEPPDR
jgi:hypothetical protein